MVVLPYEGTDDVTQIVRTGLSTDAKRMFAANVLTAFWNACLSAVLFPGMATFPPW